MTANLRTGVVLRQSAATTSPRSTVIVGCGLSQAQERLKLMEVRDVHTSSTNKRCVYDGLMSVLAHDLMTISTPSSEHQA
eukprot:53835-Eustigmatos_ZCMA.PRE.1